MDGLHAFLCMYAYIRAFLNIVVNDEDVIVAACMGVVLFISFCTFNFF